MYFPYLYARQAELNAVADLASGLGSPQRVFPLLEPVDPAAKLIAALDALKVAGSSVYVVLNPELGVFKNDPSQLPIWKVAMSTHIADVGLLYPTFKETPATSIADLVAFVATYPGRRLGVVLTSSRMRPSDVSSVLAGTDHTVFIHPDANPVGYVAALTPARTVDISDNFKPKERNKDYAGDDWLGNNHTTWTAAGRAGFSDYTILPGAFKVGGGPVGAIAIHLSYEDGSDVRVQHFISATNDQKMPQSVKFTEALGELHAQTLATPTRFQPSPGLGMYQAQRTSGAFTNLSGNKRQQVSHHIFTIAKYLGV